MTALFTLVLGISTVLGTFLIWGKSEGENAIACCGYILFKSVFHHALGIRSLRCILTLNFQHLHSLEAPENDIDLFLLHIRLLNTQGTHRTTMTEKKDKSSGIMPSFWSLSSLNLAVFAVSTLSVITAAPAFRTAFPCGCMCLWSLCVLSTSA